MLASVLVLIRKSVKECDTSVYIYTSLEALGTFFLLFSDVSADSTLCFVSDGLSKFALMPRRRSNPDPLDHSVEKVNLTIFFLTPHYGIYWLPHVATSRVLTTHYYIVESRKH